jgi:hypothetical protein
LADAEYEGTTTLFNTTLCDIWTQGSGSPSNQTLYVRAGTNIPGTSGCCYVLELSRFGLSNYDLQSSK